EAVRAEKILRSAFPQATIDVLPLAKIENGSAWQRLRALRALAPDMFAVSTERLGWQQGQNALILFGALGGARRVLVFDAHGAKREETRSGVLLRAPFRFAQETSVSRKTVSSARRELARMERAIAKPEVEATDL